MQGLFYNNKQIPHSITFNVNHNVVELNKISAHRYCFCLTSGKWRVWSRGVAPNICSYWVQFCPQNLSFKCFQHWKVKYSIIKNWCLSLNLWMRKQSRITSKDDFTTFSIQTFCMFVQRILNPKENNCHDTLNYNEIWNTYNAFIQSKNYIKIYVGLLLNKMFSYLQYSYLMIWFHCWCTVSTPHGSEQ